MNYLIYRRQYLFSNHHISVPKHWNTIGLKDNSFFLYTHPDLEVYYIKGQDKEIALIGYVLDPYQPAYDNEAILMDLVCVQDFAEFIDKTHHLGGRFSFVYGDAFGVRVLPDATALREIYYYFKEEKICFASQPNLIADLLDVPKRKDEVLLKFIHSKQFLDAENNMIGDESIYENIFHLLPNHYLDLNLKKTFRFFPIEHIQPISFQEAVEQSKQILKGLMDAAQRRFQLTIAFTAGIDSRLTVALSRDWKDKILYFVNKYPFMHNKNSDIVVPNRLAKRLGINFEVLTLPKVDEIDQTFVEAYTKNYALGIEKFMPAHFNYAKKFTGRVNLLTTCSEITNMYYQTSKKITPDVLAELTKLEEFEFVQLQCEKWYNENAHLIETKGYKVLDLFYWENRQGNWGAQGSTLADISRETLSLFNCRNWLNLLLSLDEQYRQKENNKVYRQLMKIQWNDVLKEPINPPDTFKKKVIHYAKKLGVLGIIKKIYKAVLKK